MNFDRMILRKNRIDLLRKFASGIIDGNQNFAVNDGSLKGFDHWLMLVSTSEKSGNRSVEACTAGAK